MRDTRIHERERDDYSGKERKTEKTEREREREREKQEYGGEEEK